VIGGNQRAIFASPKMIAGRQFSFNIFAIQLEPTIEARWEDYAPVRKRLPSKVGFETLLSIPIPISYFHRSAALEAPIGSLIVSNGSKFFSSIMSAAGWPNITKQRK